MNLRNRFIGAFAAVALAGCAGGPRVMMPTPNLYLAPGEDVYADLSEPLKTTEVRLFYITDRAPEQTEDGGLTYGYGRSGAMAFGTAVVDLGVDLDWNDLVEASREQKRLEPVELRIQSLEELVRAPVAPVPFSIVDGQIVDDPEMVAQAKAAAAAFRQRLAEQLALTPRKDVFIYVHGYHNTFDDAIFAMAELWHFLGRIGVPIVYSWPAGYPGMFGYTYDRESSEFTVYHLRQVLRLVSSFPEVERVHLIAHSRGTDVAVAAMRELTIEARGAGLDPAEEYKVHNLVLAAADLDLQVAMQRIGGDRLSLSVDRFTIYASPADKAIGISGQLFQSPRGRVGMVDIQGADPALLANMKSALEQLPDRFAVVNFSGAGDSRLDSYGHSYFRNAPSVSSDLVLMLRDDLDPHDPGRPLEYQGLRFWRIPEGYPAVGP